MSGINSDVVLLLHFNGADAGTTFFDSAKGKSVTAVNATTEDTQKKFGATAGYFASNALLKQAAGIHSDFIFASNTDFTIDLWAYINTSKVGSYHCLLDARESGLNSANIGLFVTSRFIGYMEASFAFTGTTSVTLSTWHHFAFTRGSGIARAFLDGVLQASYANTTSWTVGSSRPYIGGQGYTSGADALNGYIDELRITKGVAVWTEDFTPPTEAYSPDIPVVTLQVTQETATRIEKTYAGVSEAVTITEIPFDISDAPFEVSLSATANNGQICKHTVDVKVLELSWLSPNAGVPFTSDLDADLAPIEATWTPVLATVDPTLFPLAGLTAHRVMDVELSPIVMDSSARAENTWQLEAILERIEGSLTGRQNVYGTINKNLRPITMSGESVYVHILGQIDATLNPIYLAEQMHANTWKAWSLAATLENITLSATGHQDVYGSIAQDLQAIGADIEIDSLVFEIIAMNLLNKAVTNFSNYPFNSFCYFNGRYYGCARDGIYELTGVSDYGTDIASYIKTGLLDLEVTALQRIRHAYLGFKSSGVLTLTITTDDGTSYSYTTENLTSNYQGQKVKFGKGFKDRYFQLKIANTDGCTFAIDKTRVFDEPISHRKR